MSECSVRNENRPPSLPLLSIEQKEIFIGKNVEKLDFVSNSFFIRGNTAAGFREYSGIGSRQNTCGGVLF